MTVGASDGHSYHPSLAFCKAVASCQERLASQYRTARIEVNGLPIPLSGEDRAAPDPPSL